MIYLVIKGSTWFKRGSIVEMIGEKHSDGCSYYTNGKYNFYDLDINMVAIGKI